jgi:FKBP-type peptidyl-prolyl cis-trans isomerase 2
VREIGETEVTLDLNHPLAGKTLEFDVEVISVGAAPSKIIRP